MGFPVPAGTGGQLRKLRGCEVPLPDAFLVAVAVGGAELRCELLLLPSQLWGRGWLGSSVAGASVARQVGWRRGRGLHFDRKSEELGTNRHTCLGSCGSLGLEHRSRVASLGTFQEMARGAGPRQGSWGPSP